MTPDSRIAEIERERQTGIGVSPTNVVWLLSQLKASRERVEILEKALRDLIAAEAEVARLKAPLSEDEVKAMVRAYWAMRPNSDSTSQEAFNRMHYEAMRAACSALMDRRAKEGERG